MKTFLVSLLLVVAVGLMAQNSGDFRSKASGNWTSTSTWQTYNGSSWVDAGTTPNSGSGVVTILNDHTVTINSTLTIDQTVVDEGGILTVDLSSSEKLTINNGSGDDLTVYGTLNLTHVVSNGGYGLTGSGKTVINGTCNWNSGHITNSDFNIASGGVMNMEGSGECRINWDGTVNNAGIVNFAKTSIAFVMYYNGRFNNQEGGVFNATTNESIYFRSDLGGAPVFNNAGTFRKKTGTGTTTINKMNFNNTGTVDVQSGTLKFTSFVDGTHTGTFTIAAGAMILTEENSDHNFDEGSAINGAGTFEITNGLITMNGTTNGTAIGSDVTFKLSGNSRLNGDGKLSINGTFEWTSTGLVEPEILIINSGGNLNISGDSQKTYRAYPHGTNRIDNYGTITWTGTGALGSYGAINNKSSGVIDIQNNATLDASGGAWTVINDGLIKKTAGTGTSSFRANVTNNGTLQVDTGTLDLYTSTLTNYNDNSEHPWLNGGVYDLQGKFKFKAPYDRPIEVNNAIIILDGSESGILLYNGSDALANLAAITSDGSLTLRDSRDFTSGASVFDNYGTLDCGTNVFSNNGNFKNWDYARLILGSPVGITSSGSTGNIQSSGTRIFHTDGKYHYNGSSAQVTGNGLPSTVRELTVDNASGVTLSNSLSVNSHLTVTSGDLNLNGKNVELGSAATLSEAADGRITGSGTIQTTRDLSNITSENVAGLGAEITTSANMGSTTIIRGHTAQTGAGETGIQRYYDISPTANTGLDAAFVFHYNTEDLNGQNEATLCLWKSSDGGSTWLHQGGLVDTEANTITLSGINAFSRWTAADIDHPLPAILYSFTATYSNFASTLSWTTQSENNNLGWNVYRSLTVDISEGSVQNIALIEGSGTTSEPTCYSFTDPYPVIAGHDYWYWLESINFSGESDIYGPVLLSIPHLNPDQHTPVIPEEFGLYQNYPNPFNPDTQIRFALKHAGTCDLSVFDIKGRKVKSLLRDDIEADHVYNVIWNGDDESGRQVSSGIYFYRLNGEKYQETKKMILMK
jgi:hypothetical protein